jgi:hypothetical protein
MPSNLSLWRFAQPATRIPRGTDDEAGVDRKMMPVTPLPAGDNSQATDCRM